MSRINKPTGSGGVNGSVNANGSPTQGQFPTPPNSISKKVTPGDFVFLQELGHGSYSTVYKATMKYTPNQFYAIKVCSKTHIIKEKKIKYVTIEKNTLTKLSQYHHPGIVNLHYTFHDQNNLYFVLDYIPNGEVFHFLYSQKNNGSLPDNICKKFALQLIDSLEFLHQHNIVHRDLKPENILLNEQGRVMITDFGAANALKDQNDQCQSFVGTSDYVSPELLLHNSCSYPADIWALGCILFQFKQGVPPFRGQNEMETFENIIKLNYTYKKQISPVIREVIDKLLVIDPQQRMGIAELHGCKWFQDINWNNKQMIWLGIWESTGPAVKTSGVKPALRANGLQYNAPSSTGAQGLVGTMPYMKKRKPITTNSIVEWRKQLGLNYGVSASGIGQPSAPSSPCAVATNLAAVPPAAVGHPQPQKFASQLASAAPKPMVQKQPVLQPQVPPPDPQLDAPQGKTRQVLQQETVQVYEIPFDSKFPTVGLSTYGVSPGTARGSALLLKFLKQYAKQVLVRSEPAAMEIAADGAMQLRAGERVTAMGSVHEEEQFQVFQYEEGASSFLILEQHNTRLWCVSGMQLDWVALMQRLRSAGGPPSQTAQTTQPTHRPPQPTHRPPQQGGPRVQANGLGGAKAAPGGKIVYSSSRFEVLSNLQNEHTRAAAKNAFQKTHQKPPGR